MFSKVHKEILALTWQRTKSEYQAIILLIISLGFLDTIPKTILKMPDTLGAALANPLPIFFSSLSHALGVEFLGWMATLFIIRKEDTTLAQNAKRIKWNGLVSNIFLITTVSVAMSFYQIYKNSHSLAATSNVSHSDLQIFMFLLLALTIVTVVSNLFNGCGCIRAHVGETSPFATPTAYVCTTKVFKKHWKLLLPVIASSVAICLSTMIWLDSLGIPKYLINTISVIGETFPVFIFAGTVAYLTGIRPKKKEKVATFNREPLIN